MCSCDAKISTLAQELETLRRDHMKLLFALIEEREIGARFLVCRNAACQTGDRVPHMMDERNHYTFGEALRRRLEGENKDEQ